MVALLSEPEIAERLADLDGWAGDTTVISRSYKAPSFPVAIELVSAVAEQAEAMDHHPDIDIRWRTVHFAIATHSAGGVTELDVELARRIDVAARERQAE